MHMPLNLTGRDAILPLTHEVHGEKPLRQIRRGFLKYGALLREEMCLSAGTCETCLRWMPVELPLAVRTVWCRKPAAKEMQQTCGIIRKPPVEFVEREQRLPEYGLLVGSPEIKDEMVYFSVPRRQGLVALFLHGFQRYY